MSSCFAEMNTEIQNEINAFASVQGQLVTGQFASHQHAVKKEMAEFQTVEPMQS